MKKDINQNAAGINSIIFKDINQIGADIDQMKKDINQNTADINHF
ncbi:hypothetical protein WD019_18775 [Fictibacillus sp. Mic-4]